MTGRDARRRTWTNLRKSLSTFLPSHPIPSRHRPSRRRRKIPVKTERRFGDLFLNYRKVEICAGLRKHDPLPIDELSYKVVAGIGGPEFRKPL